MRYVLSALLLLAACGKETPFSGSCSCLVWTSATPGTPTFSWQQLMYESNPDDSPPETSALKMCQAVEPSHSCSDCRCWPVPL